MRAMACLHTRYVPVRFTSRTRCHSLRSSRCTGPPPATPAAVTTPSMRPCCSTIVLTARSTCDSSRTSIGSSPSDRSTPIAVAPSRCSRSTHARPIPDAPPVTSATFPESPSTRAGRYAVSENGAVAFDDGVASRRREAAPRAPEDDRQDQTERADAHEDPPDGDDVETVHGRVDREREDRADGDEEETDADTH